jgi:GT2 family glycosyltransferase
MVESGDRDAERTGKSAPNPRPNITIGIATTGRPGILARTVELLSHQNRAADAIIVCPARDEDVDGTMLQSALDISVIRGNPGLPAQRNTLLSAAGKTDVLVFFDDDFFPEDNYLQAIEDLFWREPDVVMATGTVVADGIRGPGLSPEEASVHLDEIGAKPTEHLEDVYNGYGCNMSVRMSAVRALNLRFDEALPLYGWLEEVDFSRRLASSGRIVRSNLIRGVHLGVKGGRSSGVRLGYSQIVNPLYMVRKGTLERGRAYKQIGRNIIANALKTLRPEPWIDRKGRLIGNLRGTVHVMRGQLDPRQILKL